MVTFQGHRPPRTILYYDVIINVTPYSPTTVVSRQCHGLGHKEHVCTRPPRCPDCGCIVSNDHVCERTYCANCRVTTHLATDPKCPAKRKVDQQLQERARRTARTTTVDLCTPRVDHRRGSKARCATSSTSRSRSRPRTQDSKTVVGGEDSVENFPPLITTSNRFSALEVDDLRSEAAPSYRRSRSRSRQKQPQQQHQPIRPASRQRSSADEGLCGARRRSLSDHRGPLPPTDSHQTHDTFAGHDEHAQDRLFH